ncbi:MAG TPA: T9SS type A sorting domain-containing protein [Bacteroidia bacterium]|nr:T9SS type A sorting domain-containing protein [Bacteroidia bacterium]HMU18673.1 T9SS type A sorting domain-containing protein [Bacteroidia bacterium]
MKNLMLNKSGGSATLATALAVSGTVTFAKGTLTTTSSNLLTINNGGTVSGASDSSYIDGPVKKIGNSAFVFPTGKGNSCRAIGISAPSNTTDAFTGEYFAGALPNDPNARQSGIDYINGSNYWNLARNTGSSQVKVTLSWNRYSSVFDSSKVKLARWNGTQWSDLGTVALSGDRTVGSATNASNLNSFGNFTLGYTAFAFASCISGAIAPDYYYNFDANNFASSSPAIFSTTLSSSGTNTLVSNYGIPNTGYSLLSDNGTDLYVPNVLIDQTSEYFAVEMYVRFDENFANRASAGFFRIQNGVHSASIDQTGISFSTDYIGITGSTAIPYENFFIPFEGINEKSFGYYTNDSWHYFCFVHKKIAAHHYQKQIWIDGKLNEGFSKDIINASITGLFINGTGMDLNLKTSSEHTNMGGYFDQVAIYLQNELCDKTIEQHGLNTTSLNVFTQNTSPYSPLTFTNAGQYDENDYPFGYAPGTGNYSEVKNVIEQLKAYPLPRYKSNRTLRRNFNWLGSNYLGEHDGTKSLNVQLELYKNWYYLFNICENTRTYLEPENQQYINYAATNFNSTDEIGIITNRSQLSYRTGNLGHSLPSTLVNKVPPGITNSWIREQNATSFTNFGTVTVSDEDFYLYKSSTFYNFEGNNSGTHFWNYSPAFGTGTGNIFSNKRDVYATDGLLQNDYLQTILNGISAKVKVISENNEVSHKAIYNLRNTLSSTPLSSAYITFLSGNADTPLKWEEFMATKGKELDNDYSNNFMNISKLVSDGTIFLNYAVDGHWKLVTNNGINYDQARYRYNELRETQSVVQYGSTPVNVRLATPDFYPRRPEDWLRESRSADHGFLWLTRSKKEELNNGDYINAPFVAPGWAHNEEDNLRPGQWLGLLKAVSVLGSDFFHVFALPDVVEPKGYVWQAATPAYAHAIADRFADLIIDGHLLEGDRLQEPGNSAAPDMMYAFKSSSPDVLVLSRKDNAIEKYVITGTVQPYSNVKDNASLEKAAKIHLADNAGGSTSTYDLQFNVRRQGSTYIFDATVNPPVFYQLDAWHEYKHPDRWSKDFWFEAEVYDNTSDLPARKTEHATTHANITNGNYTNFTSYITLTSSNGEIGQYNFQPRSANATDYYVWVKARMTSGSNGSLAATLITDGTPGSSQSFSCVNNTGDWLWFRFKAGTMQPFMLSGLSNAHTYALQIASTSGSIDVDQIVIAEDKNLALQPQPDVCGTLSSTLCVSSTFTINSGNNTASAISAITPDVVYLTDDFTIDADFNLFNNKTVICSQGVGIYVDAGKKLDIQDSRFFGCNVLWKGIVLADGSSELEITNSDMEDAEAAIAINGNSSSITNINLSNTLFDHNFYGIVELGAGVTDYSNMQIHNCIFRCSGRAVYEYGDKSFNHILLLAPSDLTIGAANEQNVFSDMDYGIRLINPVDYNIQYNYFKDAPGRVPDVSQARLLAYPLITSPTGYGALILGEAANANDDKIISHNTFENMRYGIGNVTEQLRMEQNTINNCAEAGYRMFNCNGKLAGSFVKCNQNAMSNSKNNILVEKCGSNTIQITGNDLHVKTPADLTVPTSAVYINSTATTGNAVSVDHNNIYATGDYGIRVLYEQGANSAVTITDNSITGARIGIYANNTPGISIGADGSSLAANTIAMEADDGLETNQMYSGIFLQDCNDAVIKANDIYNNSVVAYNADKIRGIAADNSQNLNICGNSITRLGYAIYFEGNCNTTRLKNNVMTDYFEGIHFNTAQFSQQGNSGDPWNNEWLRSDNNYAGFDKSSGTFFPIGNRDWYYSGSVSISNPLSPDPTTLTITSINTSPTTIACATALLTNADIDRDKEFGPVVGDSAVYGSYEDEAKYLAKEALFKRLSADTTLLTTGSAADSSFRAFYNAMRNANIGKFDSVKQAVKADDIAAAATINSSIAESNDMEANYKLINSLIIGKLAAGDTLDASDTTALESLLAQHWLTAGNSVYSAAALLGKEYYSLELPALRHGGSQAQNELPEKTLPADKVRIQPNPVNNTLFITGLSDASNELVVYDIYGRLIIKKQTNDTNSSIDVSSLSDGVYNLRIKNETGEYFKKRFVVIK